MKYSIALAASLAALVSTIEPISANSVAISSDAKLPSPTEALDTVKNIDLPKGITLSGTVEPIQAPASIKDAGTDAKNKKESDITDNQIAIANDKQDHQDHQEWYGRGLGWGVGGWVVLVGVAGVAGVVSDHTASATRAVVWVVGRIHLAIGTRLVRACTAVDVVWAWRGVVSTTVRRMLRL
ncbi:hypothetical protein Poli38472_014926 [Pythium oligandrum]|uniref:Uncharacterized protein n=1 Tax=Pythium oligandrum TaxID=41045 RepID=A0A8K1C802_PYTOL|nr:hypothetical protein Poli38472_014926 [Pythium oligandrum]|eukprot:TMW57687.1 hypothetical protein Poli38472_014926 [Pythium oligandrum]